MTEKNTHAAQKQTSAEEDFDYLEKLVDSLEANDTGAQQWVSQTRTQMPNVANTLQSLFNLGGNTNRVQPLKSIDFSAFPVNSDFQKDSLDARGKILPNFLLLGKQESQARYLKDNEPFITQFNRD